MKVGGRRLGCVSLVLLFLALGAIVLGDFRERPLAKVAANRAAIGGIAFTPDGRYLVTSAVHELDVWKIPTFELVASKRRGDVWYGPRGSAVLVPGASAVYCDAGLFGLPDLAPRGERRGVPLVYDPSGTFVAVLDSSIHLESANGAPLHELGGALRPPVAFSPGGTILAASVWRGPMGCVETWDVATGQRLATIELQEYVSGVGFTTEDEVVLVQELRGSRSPRRGRDGSPGRSRCSAIAAAGGLTSPPSSSTFRGIESSGGVSQQRSNNIHWMTDASSGHGPAPTRTGSMSSPSRPTGRSSPRAPRTASSACGRFTEAW